MFQRILVPLDGSRTSETTLEPLRRLAGPQAGQLILLTAIHIESIGFVDSPGVGGVTFATLLSALKERGRAYLETQGAPFAEAGFDVQRVVALGSPSALILDTAAGRDATLIALATHGRSGLDRWIFGSVAERVLHDARVPVLLTTRQTTPPAEGSPPRILLATDGSERSLAIAPHVVELARAAGAAVEVLSVVDTDDADMTRAAETVLNRASNALAEHDLAVSTTLRSGEPAAVICDHAQRTGAHAIALTTHGRTGLLRAMLGSVAESVVRQATTPLLIARSA